MKIRTISIADNRLAWDEPIDSPDFSSLTCKRDGKERYITGNIEHVTLPLIGKDNEPAVIDRVYSDVIAIKNIRHSFNAKGKIKGQAKEITKLVQEKIPTIDFDKFNITEIGNKSREHLFGER